MSFGFGGASFIRELLTFRLGLNTGGLASQLGLSGELHCLTAFAPRLACVLESVA